MLTYLAFVLIALSIHHELESLVEAGHVLFQALDGHAHLVTTNQSAACPGRCSC